MESRASSPKSDESRWFAEEVQPHESALRAYLHGRFPALRDIDDLVHETYLRLINSRKIGQVAHTRAYLFVTARNVALDMYRRAKIVPVIGISEVDEQAVTAEGPDAAELASREQEFELLGEAIRSLPDRCRRIFNMRKLLGFSHREIATRLGISERTVNAQLAIGVVRCRRYIAFRDDRAAKSPAGGQGGGRHPARTRIQFPISTRNRHRDFLVHERQ